MVSAMSPMTANTPPLAVTMGDPSGIGPEIIAKMFLRRPRHRHWIAVGDPLVMERAFASLGAEVPVRAVRRRGNHHHRPRHRGSPQ